MTNWALEYVRASIISGVILAEPVIAALLAWAVLFERPGMWTVVGASWCSRGSTCYLGAKGTQAVHLPRTSQRTPLRRSPGKKTSSTRRVARGLRNQNLCSRM
jgi:hypothetical protein